MAKYSKSEQADALVRLREWLKPGDTVYTILRHVSTSGMSRTIGIVVPMIEPARTKGAPVTVDFIHPNHAVSRVLGLSLVRDSWDGVKVQGAGMDMGFHVVYELARVLGHEAPDGSGWSPSELAAYWRAGGRETSRDPGYALNHRWL